MEKKKCEECGIDFLGRTDKKFCSDACRYAYNNRLKSGNDSYIRNINNILKKNRTILAGFNPTGKVKIPKQRLLTKGFNFSFFTNIYRTHSGKEYFFCYDQGYVELENDHVMLVVKQEYVDVGQ